ncbi:MAG: DoxX family protein [Cellvibrio sp.]|uniref:DoxX family protein n=1 Tax=Cellvibrio sp. TaxID=1965322 RepID=UPI0031AE111A
MNIFLWILQVLLALHTIMGAVWKFSHTAEQTMPSLKAIPASAWITLASFELLCALCLIVPAFYKPTVVLVPLAAICIAVIMLVFCTFELLSGNANMGSIGYWLVVVVLCGFIAYGRFALRPFS